jgi:uncharacterized RDD family membrane protein YckC
MNDALLLGKAIDGGMRYRTGYDRFWAAIIDSIVIMPLYLIDKWVAGKVSPGIYAIEIIFFSVLIFLYSIVGHWRFGQTVGKWAIDIQVIDVSETRLLTLRQVLLRDSFTILLFIGALIYFGFMTIKTSNMQYLANDFNEFGDTPIFCWTLLELVTMLLNSKRRALHDFLAGSIVVKLENKSIARMETV